MFVRNTSGSAILIALVVLIILTIMSTVFIEKLLHFSKASEWIENSNVAYYNALGIIEESLFTGGVNKYTPWMIQNNSVWGFSSTGKSITIATGWTSIPSVGNGNSPYDKNWNLMWLGNPVQLVIPSGMGDPNNFKFYFRIPEVEVGSNTGISLSMTNSGIIMWTFTSTGNSLFASGETNIFQWYEMDSSQITILSRSGVTNTGVFMTFGSFYTNYGSVCWNYKCTLKLSMIRPITTFDNRKIPFLEYKIGITGGAPPIPEQFMKIEAKWYAYGFMRSRTIELPQITTSNALDFAVLQ